MSALLEVTGLRGGYGRGAVLHGLDLTAATGDVAVILGPNGAGKTSFLRALSGTLPSVQGEVRVQGKPLGRLSASRRAAARGVVHVPQGRGTFAGLSVADNLAVGSLARSSKDGLDADIAMVYDLFPVLAERRKQHAGLLSGGEQQMLAVSRAFLARPTLLLLDEPSLGLSPLMVRTVYGGLRAYRADTGVTMVIVEQSADVALEMATEVRLLESGEFTFTGTPHSVKADGVLAAAYLGRRPQT